MTQMSQAAADTVMPAAVATSASLNLLMIRSGVCFFLAMPHSPFCPES